MLRITSNNLGEIFVANYGYHVTGRESSGPTEHAKYNYWAINSYFGWLIWYKQICPANRIQSLFIQSGTKMDKVSILVLDMVLQQLRRNGLSLPMVQLLQHLSGFRQHWSTSNLYLLHCGDTWPGDSGGFGCECATASLGPKPADGGLTWDFPCVRYWLSV